MKNAIVTFIAQKHLITKGDTVILGLSGGPDSIFLLHFLAPMHETGDISLIAAHIDHEWRPDSHNDVLFCHDACLKLGIPFVYTSASELGLTIKKGSAEQKGRIMRRHFLQSIAQEHNAHTIALAHHAQDQQETFFIRLIRGATLSGLAAMRPKYGRYIRPLLATNKDDILASLDKENISYLVDPSNVSQKFLRNRIRLNVLPALRECDERFDKHFARTMHNIQESEHILETVTKKTFEAIAQLSLKTYHVDCKELFTLAPYLQRRIIMYWLIVEQVPFIPTERFLNEIIRFLQQPAGGTHSIHQSWKIVKKKNKAILLKHNIKKDYE